ncbi:MAG: M23 family metallopeptidase [Salibacteraceae bacterium]
MKVVYNFSLLIFIIIGLSAFKKTSQTTPNILPIKKSDITKIGSSYGMRTHPTSHVQKMHDGVDYIAPIGTKVIATADGKVTKISRDQKKYGLQLTITHANGVKTSYSHLSEIIVELGEEVNQKQVVAKVGNTGASTGPHLHYEIEVDNKKVNPATFINN